MNRRIFIISAFCFLFFALSADTWLQTYDPFDEAIFNVEDVVICSDGGYAINGTCIDQQTTIGWGFVIKTDSNGNMLWANRDIVDFQAENDSRAFIENEDGGFLSSSYYWGNGTALLRRDNVGDIEESILLEDIAIHSMCNTYDENYILTGQDYTNSATDQWPCLIKCNQNLEILWQQIYEFDDYEWGVIKSVIQSSDSGFLLTGYVYDVETEDAILVIKTNAEGDTLWTRILDVTDEDDLARTIIESYESDIVIGGEIEDVSGFLWKLDSEGNTIWLETGTENCGYEIFSLVNTDDGKFISLMNIPVTINSIRKFDFDFNIEWTNDIPYYNANGDKALGVNSDGNIIIALQGSSFLALTKLNPDGTDVDEEIITISKTTINAFPNPFKPSQQRNSGITINFENFKNNEDSQVNIYNIKGRRVKQFEISKRQNSIQWNGANANQKQVSSGVYFVTLNSGGKTIDFKKITIIK
jgi:hypothetical protein